MFENGNIKLVYSIALVCFFGTFLLILLSKGTYDPGDGVQHYLIAKYAIKHPLLLLDHWGKPIYTLLCLPFAQFGFLGSNVYNLLCNTLTSFLGFKIAHRLGFKNAWLAFVLVFFSPLFFMTSFSGLTEPTFALILSFAIWLMINKNYAFGAIIISFLPFARTEGFFILPLFALYLVIIKKWKFAALTALATLIYAIIGYFVLHDFLWIIHQNPYKGAIDIYGKGPLMHFVAANDRLFGLPLVALFTLACFVMLFKKEKVENEKNAFNLLIIGSFLVYFTLHSVFWWKGLFGSLGLHRVMAGVAPLFSLVALIGFNFLGGLLASQKKVQKSILAFIVLAVIIYPFKQYQPPIKPDSEMQVLMNTANWIKANNISLHQKVYCMYPMLSMLLDIDVFDSKKYLSTCMLKHNDFNNALTPGDVIIWDSHFGNECGFMPDDIAKLPKVKQLTHFKHSNASNKSFEVFVFKVIN